MARRISSWIHLAAPRALYWDTVVDLITCFALNASRPTQVLHARLFSRPEIPRLFRTKPMSYTTLPELREFGLLLAPIWHGEDKELGHYTLLVMDLDQTPAVITAYDSYNGNPRPEDVEKLQTVAETLLGKPLPPATVQSGIIGDQKNKRACGHYCAAAAALVCQGKATSCFNDQDMDFFRSELFAWCQKGCDLRSMPMPKRAPSPGKQLSDNLLMNA